MRHDPVASDAVAIECRGLYKVFGRCPQEALSAMRSEGLGKDEVRKRFDCVVGVDDVSFAVRRGEVFCIMGLSGSGKSTLVRHINRLVEPTAGSVLINGEDIGRKQVAEMRRLRSEKIGMVFQNFALLPHLNVLDNVAFGLELRQVPRPDPRAHRPRQACPRSASGLGDGIARSALRRHAAARRPRAGACRRSGDSADGRAVRRPGSA